MSLIKYEPGMNFDPLDPNKVIYVYNIDGVEYRSNHKIEQPAEYAPILIDTILPTKNDNNE
jgi:hypothetical protein